jgi:hypothetical protein
MLEQICPPIEQQVLELGIEVKKLEKFLAKPSLQSRGSR